MPTRRVRSPAAARGRSILAIPGPTVGLPSGHLVATRELSGARRQARKAGARHTRYARSKMHGTSGQGSAFEYRFAVRRRVVFGHAQSGSMMPRNYAQQEVESEEEE